MADGGGGVRAGSSYSPEKFKLAAFRFNSNVLRAVSFISRVALMAALLSAAYVRAADDAAFLALPSRLLPSLYWCFAILATGVLCRSSAVHLEHYRMRGKLRWGLSFFHDNT